MKKYGHRATPCFFLGSANQSAKLKALETSAWLTQQSAKLNKAWAVVESNAVQKTEKAVSELEEVVKDYVAKADEGTIFEIVFGYENIVFNAQEKLAMAYSQVGRYDDALVLHRYVAETIQSIVHGRHRNQKTLQDVRESDIDHLATTAAFLVHFSRHMAGRGEIAPAWQLLNEAIKLSDLWGLKTKRPKLASMINEQHNVLVQQQQ
jgi:hypothetical protein